MLITIFASVGCQNLGDELILKNEIKLLEKRYGKNTQFIVFSYDIYDNFLEKENVDYVEYFPIGIKNPKNWMRNFGNFINFLTLVIKSDLIVVGGGGILYDHEVQHTSNPLNQRRFRSFFFRFFKKQVEYFSIGVNIKNEKNERLLEKIFSPMDRITVRDSYSYKLLKKLYVSSEQTLDPVFYDAGEAQNVFQKKVLLGVEKSKKITGKEFQKYDFSNKTVGLALRMGFMKDEQKVIERLIHTIEEEGGKAVLLPHSFHKSDVLANDFAFLKDIAFRYNLKIVTSMKEVYHYYKHKKIDMCISMRLHSVILSQVYAIPFIALSYSKKTDEIVKNLDKVK